MKKLLCIFIFFVSIVTSFAQEKQIETSIDSTKIRIGSQFHLILKTKVDTASAVIFPKEQMFGALEVLEDYPTDTIIDKKNRAKYELIKKYGLTQFDSGKYVIPQLKVIINNKPFLTDSLFVEVANIQVDTLKQPLYDIKDVIAGNQASSMKWWMWVLIALVLIGGGIWAFLQWKKNKKSSPKEAELIYTPIEKATIGLKKLEEKQLIEKGAVKDYYSELTDIARTYLEEAIKIPAMENTTAELVENLKRTAIKRKLAFSDEIISSLEKVLRQADLVKFAKSKPLDFEIVEDRNSVEKTLRTMHGIIPLKTPEEEEAERNEELRLELERKRKKKKMISNISFAAGIIVVVGLAYWIATSGVSTIKNKFFGSPTTAFLTSDWITSEYGNPPVKIETPKVLKRMQSSDFIPDEMKALFKDVNMFGDGAMLGDYYIMVSTMKFQEQAQKEASQIDLNLVLDGNYAIWEKQGAKNILMQKEQYQTVGGIEGMKAYGTLDFLNPITKSSTKVYYEMLVFKQAKGIQQVIAIIKESDPNKKEIIDRIINSVELGQAR
jgi:hypothetical protein